MTDVALPGACNKEFYEESSDTTVIWIVELCDDINQHSDDDSHLLFGGTVTSAFYLYGKMMLWGHSLSFWLHETRNSLTPWHPWHSVSAYWCCSNEYALLEQYYITFFRSVMSSKTSCSLNTSFRFHSFDWNRQFTFHCMLVTGVTRKQACKSHYHTYLTANVRGCLQFI